MAKKGKYSNWAKSFGQSVKFGAKDVLTELAPSIAETHGSIADDVRELRQDLRKLRSNKRQIINYLLGEEEQFSKYGKELVKNAKSSLMTGKVYDPKRSDKAVMKAMGMDDFDMDFNDSFDDSGSFEMNGGSDGDFGDLDTGSSTNIVNMPGPSTEAMQSVSLEVGKTNEAITSGFEKMSISSKNNFAISEAMEKRFHTERMSQLTAINNNLVSIVQYNNETTSKFVTASLEFYDKNIAILNSINEAMLRVSPVPKETKRGAKAESPVDMFMQGGFSLKGYSQLVAKNARNSFQNSMMGAIFPMMNNEMLLADMAANPWSIPLKWGIESIIPDRFKKSLSSFDKTANSFIPAALAKLGNYKGDSTIMQFISEIFGTRTRVSAKKFNQNEYERGPIPFDGETKAAITRIIPGYLSRMSATLEVMAGAWLDDPDKLESMIDTKAIVYNTAKDSSSGGRFMRKSEAMKVQQREQRDTVTRSYSDARWALRTNVSEHKGSQGIDRSSEIDNYLIGLTNSNEDVAYRDIQQIKRFILMGETGKSADQITDADLKGRDINDKAHAVAYALKKLTNAERLGMAGAERQQARVNLSNYNSFYGSDAEKGIGRHAFISQLEPGAATNLYSDKDYSTVVSNKYRLEKLEDGTYTMPKDKIEQYNKDHGYDKKKGTWLYTAKAIANDINEKGTDKKVSGTKEQQEAAVNPDQQVEQMGITDKIKQIFNAPFNKMADILDAANKKLHDIIFGADGLGGSLEDLILGKKGEDGRRTGGWFSGGINAVKDTYKETKEYLFGGTNEDGTPKPGLLSNSMKKFSDLMDEYFFGKKTDENGKERPSILDQMQSTVVRGFSQLASTLFGNKADAKGREKSIQEAKEAFNKALPDIGKGAGLGAIVGTVSGFGGFGLLGSLFLPGGPIGGALVGGAVGLLSQSKAFREMLFGKETTDEKGNTKRVGGLISDKVQKFFKAKKTAIFGGAAMGTISTAMGHGIAFGLMPSIAVGAFGPVVAGAAWGLLSHSKKFREMIFGKEVKNSDGTTKKIGGLLNGRMMRSFKVKLPRAIAGAIAGVGSMGVISQLGLVGNMVALGPIPAAIAGAGLGIASASKKFTRAMFGYTDASGKYHSGALDRFKNYMNIEVLEPMKLYAREQIFHAKLWVRKNVFRTISRSIRPFKRVMSDTARWMQKRFKMVADPITAGFTMVFKTLADKITSILDPVVKLTKKMAEWTMERFKSAVKMSIMTALLPLRAIGGMMNMLIKGKDYKSSVLDAARGVGTAIMSGSGVVGALGTLGKSVFNPDLESDEEKQEKKEAKAEEKALLKGDALFAASRAALKERQRQLRENGYNLTDDQIAAMKKEAESEAKTEAKVVSDAKKSNDPALQLAAKGVEQRAETNTILGQIRDNMRLTSGSTDEEKKDLKEAIEDVKNLTGENGIKSTKPSVAANIGAINYANIGTAADETAAWVSADDNATTTDEKNKAEKEKEEAIDREEKKTEFLGTISDWCKKKLRGDDKKKPSLLEKLFGAGSTILSGLMSLVSFGSIIAGLLGGISGLLSFAFGDNDTRRHQTESEAMGNIAERGARGALKFGGKLGKGIANFMGKTNEEGVSRAARAGKAIKGAGSKIKGFADKAVSKLKGLTEKAIENPANEGIVAKFLSQINKGLTTFLDGGILDKFPNKEKVAKFFKDLVESIAAKLKRPDSAAKIIEYATKSKGLLGTAIKGVAKSAAGVITGGLLTAAFGVYDGISGAVRAGFLFDISDEDVDFRMRLIAGAINAFFGLPGMFVIDVGLSLASIGLIGLSDTPVGKTLKSLGINIENFDHRKIVAQALYRLTGDAEENAKLDESQAKLLAEYKAHLEKNHLTEHQMSLEEFQTKQKGQGGLWKQFGAPILNRMFGIDDPFANNQPSFMDRVKDAYEGLVKWFKDSVKAIMDFHPIDYLTQKLDKFWDGVKERFTNWLPGGKDAGLTDEYKNQAGAWDRFKGSVANFFKRDKNAKSVGSNKLFGGKGNSPYISQNDPRWKNKRFGTGTFGDEACGPISFAMISRMLGRDVSPEQAAAMSTGFQTSGGVLSGFFANAANKLGMAYRENRDGSDVVNAIMSGVPTIFGGTSTNPNSPFYGNGHYVVADGVDGRGNVNIMNPSGKSSSGIGVKQLLSETISKGGYSGSFIGGGRASLASVNTLLGAANEARATTDFFGRPTASKDNPDKNDPYVLRQLKEGTEPWKNQGNVLTEVKSDEDLAAKMTASVKAKTDGSATTVVDEESAATIDDVNKVKAKTNGVTETITKNGKTITRPDTTSKPAASPGSKSSTTPSAGSSKLGFTDILTGFGLGLKNLFSAIWGGEKYKNVTTADIKGGLSGALRSLFGGGRGSGPGNCACYKQDDERWWDHPYTFSTVAQGGCMPTSFCNMASMYGVDVIPPDACDFAGERGFHVSGGTMCAFYPAASKKWGVPVHAIDSWDQLMNDLKTGHPVGAGFEGGDGWSTGGHWMLLTHLNENGDIYVVDSRRGVHNTGKDITGFHSEQETYAHWAGPGYAFGADNQAQIGGAGGSFDSASGNLEDKQKVWAYLVNDLGMNRAGAAGVMGNIEKESGFRTAAIGDNGTSGGLVQWHDEAPGVGRFTNLKNFAASQGLPFDSLDAQLGYLGQELNEGYTGVYNKVKSAGSVENAVDAWVRDFERPANIPGEIADRTPIAQSYYDNASDFVGGANFMSTGQPQGIFPMGMNMSMPVPRYNSGGAGNNPLANMITGGLFNMVNRYNERGRQKKVAELKKMVDAGVPESQIPAKLLKYKKFLNAPTTTSETKPTAKVLTDIIAPNGKKYERNDIDYLLNSGYSIDSAIELLSKDKKYAKAEEDAAKKSAEVATKQASINDDIIKKYAETHKQVEVPKPATVTNANVASARVLPSKIDTGGASMDDLLISIRALDSHRELEQIINYLSIIAKTGVGSVGPKLDQRTERQLKSQIDRTRNDSKSGSPSNGISPQRYKDLMNTMDGLDGYLNKDMFNVAVDIAKGGNFRTS